MPGFRLLLRIAPVVVGLVVVSVWLRRRSAGRRALSAAEGCEIGPAPASESPKAAPPRRFQRDPIDIVTVVDDLLVAGH